MKQILSNNFLKFSFIASFLGISSMIVLYKMLPLFFWHTVYYCQQTFRIYSLQIPRQVTFLFVSLTGLFLLSFFIKLSHTLWKQYFFRKSLVKNVTAYAALMPLLKKLRLQKHVSVVNSMHPFAFCLGLRSPHIYLSTQVIRTMNQQELEAILWHEKYHLEHKDSLTLFIAFLAQFLFPFFPIISDLLQQYKIEREIQADNVAIKKLETKEPLINVLKKLLQTPASSLLFASAIGESVTLESRIRSLINEKPPLPRIKKRNIIISMFSFGLLIASIAVPVHATEVHTSRQDSMMVCLEGNNCASWCKEHNTVVPYSPAESASHMYTPLK